MGMREGCVVRTTERKREREREREREGAIRCDYAREAETEKALMSSGSKKAGSTMHKR